MRKMVYKYTRETPIILDSGCIDNYEYLILSLHSHPCAYIILEENDRFYGEHYDNIPIDVHGGLTYANTVLGHFLEYSEKYKCDVLSSIKDKWIIGWDYAHFGDYVAYAPEGKRWTTEEIKCEVINVIKQLNKLNGDAKQ